MSTLTFAAKGELKKAMGLIEHMAEGGSYKGRQAKTALRHMARCYADIDKIAASEHVVKVEIVKGGE